MALPLGVTAALLAALVAIFWGLQPHLASLSAVLPLAPAAPAAAPVSPALLRRCIEAGAQLAESADHAAAAAAFERCAIIAPGDPTPHQNLGVTYAEMGDPRRALAAFQAAVDRLMSTPRSLSSSSSAARSAQLADLHNNMALTLLHELNEPARAVEQWTLALRAGPVDTAGTLFALGNAHLLLADFVRAEAAFSAAIDAATAADVPQQQRASGNIHERVLPKYYYGLAKARHGLGADEAEILALYKQAMAAGDAVSLHELGLWVKDTDPAVSALALKTAMQRDPAFPHMRSLVYTLGMAYRHLGMPEREHELYEHAVARQIFLAWEQRPSFLLTSIAPGTPWLSHSSVSTALQPIIGTLERHFEALRDELLGASLQPEIAVSDRENLTASGAWQQTIFQRNGVREDGTWARFPRTADVLKQIGSSRLTDRLPKGSMELSILSGGTHIKAHCGPTNHRARLHLGLKVPAGAAIRVGQETRSWTEGRVLAFDDSFEHEVWNNSTEKRAVLIVDVWHPHLSEDERDKVRQYFSWDGRKKRGKAVRGH